MSAQRASAGVMEAWASTMASAEDAAFVQALGDDPLVPFRIARHQPGAGLGEDDRR